MISTSLLLGTLKKEVDATTPKSKYCFLVTNTDWLGAVINAGTKGIIVHDDYLPVELFKETIKELYPGETYIMDLIFAPLLSKKQNVEIVKFLKSEGYEVAEDAWKIIHGKDYLCKVENTETFKKAIEAYIDSKEKICADEETTELSKFHLFNEGGKVTGVYHNAIFEHIKEKNHLLIVGGTVYIYENGCYMADFSGAKLKSMIRKLMYPQFIKSTTINNIYALFLQDISLEASFDELNSYPSHWVCFKNGMWDGKEKIMREHSPKYKAINQIPHCYTPQKNTFGEKTEEYLNFICEDAEDREMLLQFIGYSLTKDTSQQKFLVLNGEGGTGKSTIIRLIENLVGGANVSNISLTDLQQRFASFGLMGKLLNSCADLEIGALEDTSIIKKILGEDSLRGEQKGKDAFSFKNYAKLVFSTNELPIVKSEKTNGFYRRLLVITMDKVPKKKNPNLFEELSEETDYLLELVMNALYRLYEGKTMCVSANSERAVMRLRANSDTVEAFIQDSCTLDKESKAERTELYRKYEKYCEDLERQALTKNNFYNSLRVKGYGELKTNGYHYFKGLFYGKSSPDSSLLGKNKDEFISVSEEDLENLPFN